MPESLTDRHDTKFEGFDKFVVIQASRALQQVRELAGKPKLLSAAQKYLEKEQKQNKEALELSRNL